MQGAAGIQAEIKHYIQQGGARGWGYPASATLNRQLIGEDVGAEDPGGHACSQS